jgi:hypothetical protein
MSSIISNHGASDHGHQYAPRRPNSPSYGSCYGLSVQDAAKLKEKLAKARFESPAPQPMLTVEEMLEASGYYGVVEEELSND